MRLTARPIKRENLSENSEPIIEKDFLCQLELCEPWDLFREIDATLKPPQEKDNNMYGEMKIISKTTENITVWEYDLPHLSFELYFPPITFHQVIVQQRDGGEIRMFVNGRESKRPAKKREVTLIPAHTPVYFSGFGSFNTLHIMLSPEFVHKAIYNIDCTVDHRMELGVCTAATDVVASYIASAIKEYALTSQWKALNCLANALSVHLLERYGAISNKKIVNLLTENQMNVVNNLMMKSIGYGPDFEKISRDLRLSTASFFRLFRETTGATPIAYFRNLRMQKAKELVESSRKSLTEIAIELGFTDAAHFSKAFRQFWKIPPSALRG